MGKLVTVFASLCAAGLGAYGVRQQFQPEPEPRGVVTSLVTPAVIIPTSPESPVASVGPVVGHSVMLPRAAAMFLQAGVLTLSQPAPSPLGIVALSPNSSIGGSGQSGYTGVGGGYAWAAYAWHIPYHLVPFEPDDAMVFLEAWTDPSFTGFTPGGYVGVKFRLYMGTNKITASSVLVQNMVPVGGVGGLTTISP